MLRSNNARLGVVVSWSCLLFLACSNVPRIACAQSAGDDMALRRLVENFFDFYQKKNLDGLMALWSEKSPDLVTSKQEFQRAFAANEIKLRSLTIRKIDANKDNATISAVAELDAEDIKTGKAANGFGIMNRTFRLLREGEAWKVWQYVTSERELAAALLSAKTGEERETILAGEKELVTVELVRALLSEGRRLETQGSYSIALDSYGLALSLANQMRYQIGVANALRSLGNVCTSQGDYVQALEYQQKSLKISEEIGEEQGIAGALGNIGNVHYLQGNYTQAAEYLQKSLKIDEKIGRKQGMAITLNVIGLVHVSQSNYTQALKYFQKSLKIKEELGEKRGIAITLTNMGLVHVSQGNYAQAMEYYHKGLKIREEMGDKEGIATTLNNIGVVHRSQGNYAQAMEHYQKSLKIREEIGDKRGIAATLNNIGVVHTLQGNYAQAMEYLQRSVNVSKAIGQKQRIAHALGNIGNIYYLQGDYARAAEHYQEELKIREEVGDKQEIASALGNIGNAHLAQGDYRQAREVFAGAIAVVEELRRRVAGNEQQQQQFFQSKLSPYHGMIRLSIDEKNPAEAFGYAERVKGRALLDTLQIGRVDVAKAVTESERAEEQRLNAEVVSLNTQIYRENLRKQPDKAVLINLEARREKARASYEAFQINLYAAHPELKIQRGEMKPISLNEAGKIIPSPGTAIVEYVVTEDKTYLFVLVKGQQSRVNSKTSPDAPILKVYTLDIKQKELADRVGRFHGRLTQKDIDFSTPSRELYDLLIGPARADLRDRTNLIIVPDDVLWQVPFQALQPSVNRFLIQDYTVSYAPSLTVLREMMHLKQSRRPATGGLSTLLAFGNPDLDPATTANLQTIYQEVLADKKLLPLPQTENLVKRLSRLYGPDRSKFYVRAEAREDRAKKEAANFRILQFATHGILDNTNPMYSRLVMSQSGVDEHEDGMLEAWEIMKLDLNAEMVILSACDTARGRVAGGEGMIGLAWAFFVAGCPTTVVSQWPVEVNSSTELMIEFHEKLKPGIEGRSSSLSKAGALRAAMLKLMRNPRYRHPFYWAPFVAIGDSR